MKLFRRVAPSPALSLPIETPRLFLRDFEAGDADAIHAYSADETVTRYLVWGPNTPAQSREAIKGFLSDQKVQPRTAYDLAIILKGARRRDDRLIGGVGLNLTDIANRTADIGYVLHRDFWGKGYAAEAASALMGAGFHTFGLQRITAICDQRNKASARVMERLGMRREAAFRQSKYIQGAWRDEFLYAILATEYYS